MTVPEKRCKVAQGEWPWSMEPTAYLTVHEVPEVFQERAIYTGYRPPGRPSSYYIRSILQIHNETVNIWTHSLGLLIIGYLTWAKVTSLPPDRSEFAPLFLGYGFCCMVCCAASVAAHTLHSRSVEDHYNWFLVDYTCIGLYALCSGLLVLYASADEEQRLRWGTVYPLANFLICIVFAVSGSLGRLLYRNPHTCSRKLWYIVPIAVQAVMMAFVVLPRLLECVQSPDDCSRHPGIQNNIQTLILLILTAIFFSAHAPERIWPGRFDIVGHGHQLFHVMHIILVTSHMEAALQDVLHKPAHAAVPDNFVILLSLVSYMFVSPLLLRASSPFVQRRIAADSHATDKRDS